MNLPPKYLRYKSHLILGLTGGLAVIVLFICLKLIEHYYSEIVLGGFSMIVVLIQMGNLLSNFGMHTLLLKKFSASFKPENRGSDYLKKILSTALGSSLAHSFLYISTIFLIHYFIYPVIPNSLSEIIGLIALCSAFFAGLTSILSEALRGAGGKVEFQLLQGLLTYFLLTILILLDVHESTLEGLCFLLFYSYLGSFSIAVVLSLRRKITFTIAFSMPIYKRLINSSKDFFFIKFLTQGFNWLTIIFTTYFISQLDAGGINVILKYLSFSSFVIIIVNANSASSYARTYFKGRLGELNQLIKHNNRFLVILNTPILFIMFLFSSELLRLFSDQFVHLNIVFRILLVCSLINTICGSTGLLMQMTGNQSKYRQILSVSITIFFLLGLLLSYLYGITGLAVAMGLHILLWNVWTTIHLKRHGIVSYATIKLFTN